METTGRIAVIANGASGKGRRQIARLKDVLDRHPGRFALRIAGSGRQLKPVIDRAADEGFRTLVAAGGDGTINAVAARLAGTDRSLGVIPMGTFNYFARGLSLPDTIEGAIDVLLNGQERLIGIGAVNGVTFLNNASLGAYPAILAKRERIYRRWGRSRAAAFWSVFKTLIDFRRPLTLMITVDGHARRVRTPSIFVASNPYQLDFFSEQGARAVRGGRLALMVAPDERHLTLVLHALRVGAGFGEHKRDYDLITGQEIFVETARARRLLARDGERGMMRAPFRFEYRPDALRVIVPREDRS